MTTSHDTQQPGAQQPRADGAHWTPKQPDHHRHDAAEVARLKARIHELEEALRPFAGVVFLSDALDDDVWDLQVQVDDLRRAREVLYGRPRMSRPTGR
jgi:uncharacterized protein with von Willebrand factor type A (vWA) domain